MKHPICFDAFGSTWAHRNPPANLCIYPAACSVSEIINEYQRTGASGSRNDDGGALITSLFFFMRLTEVKFCFIRPKNLFHNTASLLYIFVNWCLAYLFLSLTRCCMPSSWRPSWTCAAINVFFFCTIQMGCHFQVSCVHRLFFFFFRRKPTVDFTFDISLWQILPCYLILLSLSLSEPLLSSFMHEGNFE